ncbi:DUF4249 domain-containing protein [Flectobacillus major]|jgi:hypothetical protein|uniref:DUF4249 domain-containing protein n=1 Tax=Flectobacillus major TaxID=103 RepID=UPI0004002A08|nr:DUF4249 domain-containing protein [Flectobacillus major]
MKPLLSLFLLFCIGLLSCVETYDVEINTSKGYLLVDGVLTDLNEPQVITISRTLEDASFSSSEYSASIRSKETTTLPVTQAQVKVVVNDKETLELTEIEPGYYQLPNGFRGKVGNTYQLMFLTTDGKRYTSSVEKMLPVPTIKNIYDEFNPKGIKSAFPGSEQIACNNIYVDFDDTANEKNFYRWRWVNWEIQTICETCRQGKYYLYETGNGITGDCYRDLTLLGNNLYDYSCDNLCWDIFYSSDINIQSDIYTDGQSQKGKLAAQIPLIQSNASLVSVQQMSLTPNAYRNLKLLQDQSVNTGTLADTPPAPIKSNVNNIKDEQELVLGFFTVSSVSEIRFNLTRKNTSGGAYNNIFKTINNRDAIYEEPSNERPYIPLAICKKSRKRTPSMPQGWK